MSRGGEKFGLPEAEAAEVHSERSLLDGFLVQVAAQDPLDELSGEVIEAIEQVLAKEGAVSTQQVRNLRCVSAQATKQELHAS